MAGTGFGFEGFFDPFGCVGGGFALGGPGLGAGAALIFPFGAVPFRGGGGW